MPLSIAAAAICELSFIKEKSVFFFFSIPCHVIETETSNWDTS